MGVANYYGFSSVSSQKKTRGRRSKKINRIGLETRKIDALGGELALAIQRCTEKAQAPLPEPLLFYHSTADAHMKSSRKTLPKKLVFSFGIVGAPQSIAEALIIRTTLAILEELGQNDTHVFLNSIGDRDSAIKFGRELSLYLKKNQDTLPPQIQTALKEDVFIVLEYLRRKQHELCDDIPRPMEFLSEGSRRHLREIIEYLDSLDVSYELDDTLVGHKDCYTNTIFEIRKTTSTENKDGSLEHAVLAKGGRCDEFSRRFLKTDEPSVGVVLVCNPEKVDVQDLSIQTSTRKPKACFIQLGFDAKLRGLGVIETLRKARVPLYQTFVSTTLAGQIADVEERGIPYTIIMGQKEALEGTVIVRNMSTRSQDIVPVDLLPQYIKQIS